ncbi:hypothetical protein WJX74_010608 [Apatococcus lobatus]|uniref:DUF302 domain-containing protein n=1 Tax=Apatococcus lobatus TaxID=904363 RepID=A0AAW1S4C3_9CHLO
MSVPRVSRTAVKALQHLKAGKQVFLVRPQIEEGKHFHTFAAAARQVSAIPAEQVFLNLSTAACGCIIPSKKNLDSSGPSVMLAPACETLTALAESLVSMMLPEKH